MKHCCVWGWFTAGLFMACSSAEGYAEVAEMHFYKGEEEIVPIRCV